MKRIAILLIPQLLVTLTILAQPGEVDPLFRAGDTGEGDGPNGSVNAVAVQQSGKFVIGGSFTLFDHFDRQRIARLNPNGYSDPSFQIGTGFNGVVNEILVTADDKLLVAGSFTSYDGVQCGGLVRLETDGTLDATFNNVLMTDGSVSCIWLNPDGSMMIGGSFNQVDGQPFSKIVKLDANGTLDPSFTPEVFSGSAAFVNDITVQSDGNILVTGYFSDYGGVARNQVLRLLPDASLDLSFDIGAGPNASSSVFDHLVLPDGRVAVAGVFSSFNGSANQKIVLLDANGTVDQSFTSGFASGNPVFKIKYLPDQTLMLCGSLDAYGGVSAGSLLKISLDGSLVTSFNSQLSGYYYDFAQIPSGQHIAVGHASYSSPRVRLLEADGSIANGFHTYTGFNQSILDISTNSDGTINVGGYFSTNGVGYIPVYCRLTGNGDNDPAFIPSQAPGGRVACTLPLPDGSLILGGNFTSFYGAARKGLAKLLPDGTLDNTFVADLNQNGYINALAIQQDGKLIVAGSFVSINGQLSDRLARLNSDGSLDMNFDSGLPKYIVPNALAIQSDGKIVVGTNGLSIYTSVGMSPNLHRLNNDGTVDLTFDSGYGATFLQEGEGSMGAGVKELRAGPPIPPPPPPDIRSIAVQQDGKIVIGGYFRQYDSIPMPSIARVNVDGSFDPTFVPAIQLGLYSPTTDYVLVQPDGKILSCGFCGIAGMDTTYRVVRFESDGTLDPTFYLGEGANATINCLALDPENRILVGGDFNSYNGVGRNRIVRLLNDGMLVGEEDEENLSVSIARLSAYHDGSLLHYQGLIGTGQLRVLDMLGREVMHTSINGPVGSLTLQVPAAVYVLQVTCASEHRESIKFIVE